jgi:hypothetical protein
MLTGSHHIREELPVTRQMGRFLRGTDLQVFSRTSRDRNHRQLGSYEARLCVRYCSDQPFLPEY